jgi:hypothetical protein
VCGWDAFCTAFLKADCIEAFVLFSSLWGPLLLIEKMLGRTDPEWAPWGLRIDSLKT